MVKHKVQGVIVNISSISRAGNLGQTNYSAAKSAVDAMTVTWAKELGALRHPRGRHSAGLHQHRDGCQDTSRGARQDSCEYSGRPIGEMEEISRTVQFIAANDFFTGRVLEVDGGMRI